MKEKETADLKFDNVEGNKASIPSIKNKDEIINTSITPIENKDDTINQKEESRTTLGSNRPNKIGQ